MAAQNRREDFGYTLQDHLTRWLSRYMNRNATRSAVLEVFGIYGDLKPNLQPHIFNDGSRKDLLTLEGTIPVNHRGSTYNIPVCMYLMETHPLNPPLCYVRPTATMEIRTGKHVDSSGRIYLPYLHEWSHPKYDLIGLIEVMRVVFGEEPPVWEKSRVSQEQAVALSYIPPNPCHPPLRMVNPTACHVQGAGPPNMPPNPYYPPHPVVTMHGPASYSVPATPPFPSFPQHMPRDAMPVPKKTAVFLSYQWDHQGKVLLLHRRLQERGYGCWMDIKQMGGGNSLYQMMDKGIREAKVVVSCVTPLYIDSQNCQDEVALAHTLKMPIIPVMLEKTTWPPPGPMSIPFAQLIYINMTTGQDDDPWKGPLFEELVRMIECFVPDCK
ncbi:uncharacterized protein LOC144866383 [Branchiostoma floridae x Branchiostoma japonicum]